MDKLIESSNLLQSSFLSPRPVIKKLDEVHCFSKSPRTLLKPNSTPSSSESVRKFSLDDLIAITDDEEEVIDVGNYSSSIDLDISDIFTIDSDDEEMVIMIEEWIIMWFYFNP